MPLPNLCRLVFVLSVVGAAIAVRLGYPEYLVPFAYLCLVSLLIGLQLPEDEVSQDGEG